MTEGYVRMEEAQGPVMKSGCFLAPCALFCDINSRQVRESGSRGQYIPLRGSCTCFLRLTSDPNPSSSVVSRSE